MPLTPKAFDVLAALVEQPGRLISKEELLQKVWPDTFVEESNLAYNVFALRKALGRHGGQRTVHRNRRQTRVPLHRHAVTPAQPCRAADPRRRRFPQRRPRQEPCPNRRGRSDACRSVPASSPPLPGGGMVRRGPGVCAGGVALLAVPRRALPAPLGHSRPNRTRVFSWRRRRPFAVSPDGHQLVFAGAGPDGVTRLWVRRMDADVGAPPARAPRPHSPA